MAGKNGTKKDESSHSKPKATMLSFVKTQDSLHLRGTCNTSNTQMDTSAMVDATIEVLVGIAEHLRSRKPPQSVDVDALDPQELNRQVLRRIQAIPEITEIPSDDIERQYRFLRDVNAAKPTRAYRQMREIAEEVVEAETQGIRSAIEDALNSAPFSLTKIAKHVVAGLNAINYVLPKDESLGRFGNMKRGIQALDSYAGVGTEAIQQQFRSSLRQAIAREFEATLEAVAQGITNDAVRRKVEELLPHLAERERFCSQLRTRLEEVGKHLEGQSIAACHEAATRSASVDVSLAGPTKEEILATAMKRLRCRDLREVIERVAEKLEAKLNEVAGNKAVVETPATLVVLLRWLDAEQSARAISEVVRESAGETHTVYGAVGRHGIAEVARRLYELADGTVHLSSRDHESLRVEPQRDTIVRLPDVRGPDDRQVQEDLVNELTQLAENKLMVDHAGPEEREIAVTRTVIGWPIGIAEDNYVLLMAYAESAEYGHRPHLFGLLPGCELGQQDQAALSLAKHLRKEGEEL